MVLSDKPDNVYLWRGYMDYLSTEAFLSKLDRAKKYCFILGAGASVSSGIPAGFALTKKWLGEIKNAVPMGKSYSDEIERRKGLLANGKDYERFKDINYCPDLNSSLDDYNSICDLRFLGDKDEENKDIFSIMDGKLPYIGYCSLASILTKTGSNIVITTNFDELIEKAVRDYTEQEPYPIMYESLASYATEPVTERPKILKIHRDIKVGGYNRSEETNTFHFEWKKPLTEIFEQYIPIVIGYAGTDNSLMQFLRSNTNQGIYWCHMLGSLPNADVMQVVQKKKGSFVEILEFDHIMCHIASILCGDAVFKNQIFGDIGTRNYSGYVTYRPSYALETIKRKGKEEEIYRQYARAIKAKATPISFPSLLLCGVGNWLNAKRRYSKSIKWYQRAYDYELQHTGLHYGKAKYNLGVVLNKAGRFNESEQVYREFLEENYQEPGYACFRCYALNNYAFNLLQNSKYMQAKETIDNLLNCRRCDGDAYQIAAITEYLLDHKNEAIQAIDSAVKCHQQDGLLESLARDYLSKGLIHMSLDQQQEAIDSLKEASIIHSSNDVFSQLIRSCLDMAINKKTIPEKEIIDILLQRK